MKLRMICADMLHAQRHAQQLHACARAWRPPGGWPAFSPIMSQYRAGVSVQLREVWRCAGMLAALQAANEAAPPQAA